MHKDLRELLHTAVGQSRHAVAIFLDVRGFSSFAKIAESSDAAEFLKSAYTKMLDDYFEDADFFKLTGDGMLVLYEFDRESLTGTVQKTVDLSIRLVEAFPTICADDPMVNFEVPTHLGIGMSRGAVTSLTSGDTVLDYSGRPLNLASRLMDLARPSGVVLDGNFGHDLLRDDIKARFSAESVYVKSIAEDEPMIVYCLDDHTEISAANRSPINRLRRQADPPEDIPFREVCEREGTFRHWLRHSPARTDDIVVHFEWPATRANGSKHPTMMNFFTAPGTHISHRGSNAAAVDYTSVIESIKERGAKPSWTVRIAAEYSVVDEP